MRNLSSPRWIMLKGALFLFLGFLSSALLLNENRRLRVALLLALTIWCFCRFYYFAFYVVERWVDSSYHFSGLLGFAIYLVRKHRHEYVVAAEQGTLQIEGKVSNETRR